MVPNGSQVEPKSELRTHFVRFLFQDYFWRRKGDLHPNFFGVILGQFWYVFVKNRSWPFFWMFFGTLFLRVVLEGFRERFGVDLGMFLEGNFEVCFTIFVVPGTLKNLVFIWFFLWWRHIRVSKNLCKNYKICEF